jgi:hypothetical protein
MLLQNLPRIPSNEIVTYKSVLQQVNPSPSNFTSATNVQNFTLFGLPPKWIVCGVRLQPLIQFAGVSVTSLTVQIGNTAVPNCYSTSFELTQVITPTAFQISVPNSGSILAEQTSVADNVIAKFTATGAAINALTTGRIEITVQIRPL